MRAVIQRVCEARVLVGDEVVSSIGRGLCVLVGLARDDTEKDVDWMVRKLLTLRVFEDDTGRRWAKGVKDLNLEILCVSQFTLYAQLKGNKPDFRDSMGGDEAPAMYADFMQRLRNAYDADKVKDGRFGAMMRVQLENDGPVTLTLDSPATKIENKQIVELAEELHSDL
uniref:D-aminoacyl-tRNA deacylase n=1 Tax=Plectus sambesii TaxID=2011161 RepID=A0A914WH15_9BILA